jgi:hypothetical protein
VTDRPERDPVAAIDRLAELARQAKADGTWLPVPDDNDADRVHVLTGWPMTAADIVRLRDEVRRLESEADALRSENLTLRLQLVAAESRHVAAVCADIHAAIAETEPPSMDAPTVPRVAGA